MQASIIDKQDLHRPVSFSPKLLRRPPHSRQPFNKRHLLSTMPQDRSRGKKYIAYCFLTCTLSKGLSFPPSSLSNVILCLGVCGGQAAHSLNILY